MNDSVHLTNLREMIGNDRELEQELFEEYISSSSLLIDELRAYSEKDSDSEFWKKSAHALKGITQNLGANDLSELCKKAQEGFMLTSEDKSKLVTAIEAENKKVLEYLETIS